MHIHRSLKTISALLIFSAFAAQCLPQGFSIHPSSRPKPGDIEIPPNSSFYIQIASPSRTDPILLDSVNLSLGAGGKPSADALIKDGKFVGSHRGSIKPSRTSGLGSKEAISINTQPGRALDAATTYTFTATARTSGGLVLQGEAGVWHFRTEENPASELALDMRVNLGAPPVEWKGAFFNGFCKPSFCSSEYYNQIPTYDLMEKAHQEFKTTAWTNQRDAHTSSFDFTAHMLAGTSPNIVREMETRRIHGIERTPEGVRLHVEDFFGHEQYGIPSNRPLEGDYQPGDEVLLADGKASTRTRVISVDDSTKTVLVSDFDTSATQFYLPYSGELPEKEDPKLPGLFPPGGCYLRKYNPVGTPKYYWGRLDKESDIAVKRYNRRIHVNFIDAMGDLSADGRSAMIPKDYAQHHETVRVVSSHIIERYGKASTSFIWSIFNEPDLMSGYWRSKDWDELQKFYDYSVDAILRAFEDHGYDSESIPVGGLELGAVFGTNLRIREFLGHCTPSSVSIQGVVPYNAAYADRRLDGKRSRRTEALAAHGNGKGTPCDFVVVHCYGESTEAAAKLIHAKNVALEIDPDFYKDLWVNTHESCLTWAGGLDDSIRTSFMGNGYFSTWCADVAARLLENASKDTRHAFGESILTIWPWPNGNFSGMNGITRSIAIDDNGDGANDRHLTVPMQIFNFLTLLGTMGGDYWPMAMQEVGRHSVSGFASRTEDDVRILVYSHNPTDMESASDRVFQANLVLEGIPWKRATVTEYRFDKENNSYFREAMELSQKGAEADETPKLNWFEERRIRKLSAALESKNPRRQRWALHRVSGLKSKGASLVPAIMKLSQNAPDKDVRDLAQKTIVPLFSGRKATSYTAEEIQPIVEKAGLRITRTTPIDSSGDGRFLLSTPVMANGVNFLVISPFK